MMERQIRNNQDMYDALDAGRKDAGIFWKTLAEKAGIGPNTVKKWKSGAGMRLDTVLPLLDAAGLEMVIRERSE